MQCVERGAASPGELDDDGQVDWTPMGGRGPSSTLTRRRIWPVRVSHPARRTQDIAGALTVEEIREQLELDRLSETKRHWRIEVRAATPDQAWSMTIGKTLQARAGDRTPMRRLTLRTVCELTSPARRRARLSRGQGWRMV